MKKRNPACGCPEILDEEWDLTERDWEERKFYKKRLWMLFHMPVGQAGKIAAARRDLAEKGLKETDPPQVLIRDAMLAGAVLVAVANDDVSDKSIVTLGPSKIVTKVSRGSKKELKGAVSGLLSYVRSKFGAHPRSVYFWQADCDTCREPGQEHIVVLAEL